MILDPVGSPASEDMPAMTGVFVGQTAFRPFFTGRDAIRPLRRELPTRQCDHTTVNRVSEGHAREADPDAFGGGVGATTYGLAAVCCQDALKTGTIQRIRFGLLGKMAEAGPSSR